jgi:hypothetical protein
MATQSLAEKAAKDNFDRISRAIDGVYQKISTLSELVSYAGECSESIEATYGLAYMLDDIGGELFEIDEDLDTAINAIFGKED